MSITPSTRMLNIGQTCLWEVYCVTMKLRQLETIRIKYAFLALVRYDEPLRCHKPDDLYQCNLQSRTCNQS